jgi:hypothetical protein
MMSALRDGHVPAAEGMSFGPRVVSIAGRSLCIEASSERAQSSIFPALSHLAPEERVIDRPTRCTIVEEESAWRPTIFAESGVYRIAGGGFTVVQHNPASLESYRTEAGIEFRATQAALEAGDLRAHPLCHALSAWLSGPSTQVLHAAAVAYDGAAALVVGASGRGKSTTALICALEGADFLGDDLVLVESGRGPGAGDMIVHCLFATLKLNADTASALGVESWPILGMTPKNKAVVAAEHRLQLVRSARIVALIVLDPPVVGQPHPALLERRNVVTSIASTALSLTWRTSTPSAWLATVAALARELPTYRLPVSWALEDLARSVREIVVHAAATARPAAGSVMGAGSGRGWR